MQSTYFKHGDVSNVTFIELLKNGSLILLPQCNARTERCLYEYSVIVVAIFRINSIDSQWAT